MATGKKYLSLEEAAAQLRIKTEELIRLREKGEIRGFADRGTWKFKGEDVEEFARRRQPDSDPDVAIIDDDFGAGQARADSAIDDDDELGRQATVIRKGRETSSDSDVRLLLDPGMKGSLTGSSGELPVAAPPKSDSDVRLAKEPSPSPRSQPDSDSDVKLINPVSRQADSDSDVKLIDPVSPRLTDSDSDVRLAQSDSDVKLVPTQDSDSDVKLVDPRPRMTDASSDSDVALLPTPKKGRDTASLDFDISDTTGAGSALFDDDPGITLPGDSGIQLSDDSGIRLGGDSGIRLAADSGIQLQQPADSGILLEGDDSGLTLDHRTDSGIRLTDDSGMKRLGGSSKKLKGGSSSKNLKGRKVTEELDTTAPMLLAQDNRSDDDLNTTAPMLLQQDNELSGEDLQVPLLSDSDDTAAEASVIMFEDDETDQTSATVVKKGRKAVDEDAFDLESDEESAEDELEVSDEVLGEDDELEDLDAFASDEDEFDESFESGASRIGFGAPGKIAAPQEAEWSTGFFTTVSISSLVLLIGAIISVDLLRATWAAGDQSVSQSEFLAMIGGLFK